MESRICPVCGNTYTDHPALSRKDGKTMVCPDCGLKESMIAAGFSSEDINKTMSAIHGQKPASKECM